MEWKKHSQPHAERLKIRLLHRKSSSVHTTVNTGPPLASESLFLSLSQSINHSRNFEHEDVCHHQSDHARIPFTISLHFHRQQQFMPRFTILETRQMRNESAIRSILHSCSIGNKSPHNFFRLGWSSQCWNVYTDLRSKWYNQRIQANGWWQIYGFIQLFILGCGRLEVPSCCLFRITGVFSTWF